MFTARGEGYDEVIQFMVEADELANMEMKFHYHIYPSNISMHSDEHENMLLQLLLLKREKDGSISAKSLDRFNIPKQLMGWHNRIISNDILNPLSSKNLTLNFFLQCLNCDYQIFPQTITKHNIPFLTFDKRDRVKRSTSCTGCCVQDLVINFDTIGYDWVAFPRSYRANYCSGSCANLSPAQRSMMPTNSLAIHDMMQSMGRSGQSTCCVSDAKEETPVKILYYPFNSQDLTAKIAKAIRACKCV